MYSSYRKFIISHIVILGVIEYQLKVTWHPKSYRISIIRWFKKSINLNNWTQDLVAFSCIYQCLISSHSHSFIALHECHINGEKQGGL